eukprot:1328894-Amorphochlora_amoeboformis.AAC.3
MNSLSHSGKRILAQWMNDDTRPGDQQVAFWWPLVVIGRYSFSARGFSNPGIQDTVSHPSMGVNGGDQS